MKTKKIGSYLTYMAYSATGEGTIIEVALVHAFDEKDACNRHCETFSYSPAMKAYYGVGIESFPIGHRMVKKILKTYVVDVDQLLGIWKEGGQEFKIRLRYNFS